MTRSNILDIQKVIPLTAFAALHPERLHGLTSVPVQAGVDSASRVAGGRKPGVSRPPPAQQASGAGGSCRDYGMGPRSRSLSQVATEGQTPVEEAEATSHGAGFASKVRCPCCSLLILKTFTTWMDTWEKWRICT
jgi:hypothetical protein